MAGADAKAAAEVFDIAELLEIILGHLDARNIVLLQRVDTAWRDTVQASPSLRKKMFLRAERVDPDTEAIIHHIQHISSTPYNSYRRSIVGTLNACALHVIYGYFGIPVKTSLSLEHQSWGGKFQVSDSLITALHNSRNKSKCQDSRLPMFLTQPPVQYVEIEVKERHFVRSSRRGDRFWVQNDDGIRLEQIANEIRTRFPRRHWSRVNVFVYLQPGCLEGGYGIVFPELVKA